MDEKTFELIEKYLVGQASPQDVQDLEDLKKQNPDIENTIKTMALDITAIRKYWLDKDQKRLFLIKLSGNYDRKRLWMSAAAMFAIILVVTAMVVTPVYEFVVKPIINNSKEYEPETVKPIEKPIVISPSDTTIEVVDTLIEDLEEPIVEKQDPITETDAKEKQIDEDIIPQETSRVEEIEVANVPVVKEEKKETPKVEKPKITENRILTTNQLEDYTISPINARRTGDKVICSFTMTNDSEDADIEMHSARARDGEAKVYDAKYCQLNGKTTRIKEKWKKGERHVIEITINNVPQETNSFTNISFSFQSKGKVKVQKSKSIILEVGNIK